MPKYLDKICMAWFCVALFSLLFYAFTGLTLWSQIPRDASERGILLFFFHIGGLASYPIYWLIEQDLKKHNR